MTPAEMDADLRDARFLVANTKMTVDRSRHPTVTVSSLWFFQNENGRERRNQVGAACRTASGEGWRTSRMHRGMPTSERFFPTLLEAVNHITEPGNTAR